MALGSGQLAGHGNLEVIAAALRANDEETQKAGKSGLACTLHSLIFFKLEGRSGQE